jgi:peptide deformylase
MPDIRADVTRPEEVMVEAQNLDGQTVSYEADGMFARVLQHEIDHLDGVLFIDRIPLERREFLKNRLRRLAEDASRGKTA